MNYAGVVDRWDRDETFRENMRKDRGLDREGMWSMQQEIDEIRATETVHKPMRKRDREEWIAHQHDPGEAAARHALTALPTEERNKLDSSIYDPARGVRRHYEYTKVEWDEWYAKHGKK